MALATDQRSFVVGETVHLRVRVSQPGTRVPTDATVVLTRLKGANPVPVTNTTFTKVETGDYSLVVPTVGLTPGAYDVTITVSDGPSRVTILQDRFALRPL